MNILNQKNFLTDSRQPNAHKKENQQKGTKMLLPWILITWIVLVFNLGVGILFGLDIQYPFKVHILIYLTACGVQIYYIIYDGPCASIRNFKILFRQRKMISVVSKSRPNLPIISFLPWQCLFFSVGE